MREDFDVVADMGSGEEFLAALPALDVDVVFMDISMPGIDGCETTRRALRLNDRLRIITLSMYGDEQYYSQMMESGASGFVLKDSDIEEVYASVDAVSEGDSYVCEALMRTLTRNMSVTPIDECKDCKVWDFCRGGGMHLRDDEGKLMYCHYRMLK